MVVLVLEVAVPVVAVHIMETQELMVGTDIVRLVVLVVLILVAVAVPAPLAATMSILEVVQVVLVL